MVDEEVVIIPFGEDEPKHDSELAPMNVSHLKMDLVVRDIVETEETMKRMTERNVLGCFRAMSLNMCGWDIEGI